MTKDKPSLNAAYDLKSAADNRRLYADWAASYDASFAVDHDYQLPLHTARAFIDAGGQGPVLDVGAGTGLAGVMLADLGAGPVDATDISGEMLDMAERKDVYRDLFEADLLEGLPVPRDSYSGIVSSGTFTHGHVGPDVFDELLRVARPGAQFAISINAQHFVSQGFEAKFQALGDRISDLHLPETRIYGPNATDEHKDDLAFIALFQKG
ncbi:MAG: class I SAM-dependent methyltransferase [Paracoccaceae bacterium]